jgi:succinate dehydrogenase / fumarate reductase cytochrome b subunit
MKFLVNYLLSSIGKKQVMAVTGLGLIGFVIMHLLGNLLILLGPEAFNKYAHTLTSNPLIYAAEAGLLGLFFLHMALAAVTTIQNRQARPQKYYRKRGKGNGENFASLTMPYSGVVLLIFVILHLLNFKFGSQYKMEVDGIMMRDLYRTVIEYFSNSYYVAWYVFAMITLGVHTSHGLKSSLQTFGVNHPKYNFVFEATSYFYGLFVAIGFSGLAVFSYFQN